MLACKAAEILKEKRRRREGYSDLSTFRLEVIENCLVCRVFKAALQPGLLVLFEAQTKPLRAIEKRIPERFVQAFEIVASHEYLSPSLGQRRSSSERGDCTLSKAVEQERGCVARKMGLEDIKLMMAQRMKRAGRCMLVQ